MSTLHKLLTLLILITSTPVHSLGSDAEHLQKTRLISYIINKVSWPSGSIPKSTFTVCVLGKPESITIVEELNGQIVQKRKVTVKRFSAKDPSSSCQLIYLANQSPKEQKKLISKYAKRPVLLLSDTEYFAHMGGSMNFVVLQNAVALTLNLESMKKSRLIMASEELDNVIVIPEEKDLN